MPYWLLRLDWIGYAKHLTLAFAYPPTRDDVLEIITLQWRADADADDSWEFLLICDFIPTHAFEGRITTWYGTITCQTRYMNVKN